MAFKSFSVALATSDTDVIECPATQQGAAVLLVSNVSGGSVTYTLKIYRQATGQTVTVVSAKSLAANTAEKFPVPISLEAADKIIMLCSSANQIVVSGTFTHSASTPAETGFVGRGEWDDEATYVANDVAEMNGTSYLSLQDDNLNQNPETQTEYWMVLAEKGEPGDDGSIEGLSDFALTLVAAEDVGAARGVLEIPSVSSYTAKYTASADVEVPDGCKSIDYLLQAPGGGGAGTPTTSSQVAVGGSAGSGGRVYGSVDCRPKAIEAATKANPCVITITGHPFYNGDTVKIENIGGMTELEGDEVVVAGRTADTFQLSGVNSTGFGTFTSGGTVRLIKRPLVLGTPGLGGAAGQNNGATGGTSTFGDASANSGTGGTSQAAGTAHANVNGGQGGAASGGDLAIAGAPGSRNCRLTGTTYIALGRGADSPLGAGGLSPSSAANAGTAGSDATGYGAGGGGAVSGTSGSSQTGGDGAPAILLARFNFQ
jgi:hypothetical protein